ncbi:MAG: AAA family ATPase [Acidimicrobiales bacterium]
MPPPSVRRVRLQNYKSIKACDVHLGSLAVLVGPNGSGKSNFLDALRFTTDALSTTLDNALRDRGGISEVRRRSGGHPNNFAVRLDFRLPSGAAGYYSYRIGALREGGFHVADEECAVFPEALGEPAARYRTHGTTLDTTTVAERLPAVARDRLYLVSASNVEQFRPVYDLLTAMGFYNLSPPAIRRPQRPDPGELLRREGDNLASVLSNLSQHHPAALERVVEYLRRVSPGVEGVQKIAVGSMETIEFLQTVAGQKRPWRFDATNMSDGTLRGLGVLVALFQANGRPPTLVGLEEPEVALHPAAVVVLVDAVREASRRTQVLMTSHSPELLDRDDLDDQVILAVEADQGVTTIGALSEVGRQAVRDRLFTPGELLRMNQLEPSDDDRRISRAENLKLFET